MKTADVSDSLHVTTLSNSSDSDWTIGGAQAVIPNGTTAYNASLPNGVNLITPLSYALLAQGADRSLAFVDDEANFAVMADYFVVYGRAGNVSYPGYNRTFERQWEFGAFEVLLYLCVNEYTITVDEGVSTTMVVSSSVSPAGGRNASQGLPRLECTYPYGKFQRRLYCDNPKVKSSRTLAFKDPSDKTAEEKSNFTFSPVTAISTAYNLNLAMHSQYIWSESPKDTAVQTQDSATWLSNAIWGIRGNISEAEEQFARFGRYYEGLATTLSNQFVLSRPYCKSRALLITPSLRSIDLTKAKGTAWREETFVNVRWWWLAFLGGELILSCIFLIMTIISTRRLQAPLLKSSPVATLLATSDEVQGILGTLSDLETAEKNAERMHVQLVGGKLVDGTR
jgi:hypothetical protein